MWHQGRHRPLGAPRRQDTTSNPFQSRTILRQPDGRQRPARLLRPFFEPEKERRSIQPFSGADEKQLLQTAAEPRLVKSTRARPASAAAECGIPDLWE